MFRIEFKTDNAAFGESQLDRGDEVARILREIADKVGWQDLLHGKVYDVNGNVVGTWGFTKE